MDEYTNYLVHHGIKGQRWGIRRFQNADGSLTSAGRSKYGVGPKRDKKKARADKKAAKKRAKAALERAKQIQKEKAARDRRMKTGPGAASEAVNMTEKEVQEYINKYRNANELMKERSNLDTYIDRYSPKEPSKLEKAMNIAGKIASTAESVSKFKNAYDSILGKPKPMSEIDKVELALKREKLKSDQQTRQIALENFLSKQKTEALDRSVKEATTRSSLAKEAQNRSIAALNTRSKMANEELARRASAINIDEKLYDFAQKRNADAIKKQTTEYVNRLSDTKLDDAIKRYEKENQALDFLFKYNNNARR